MLYPSQASTPNAIPPGITHESVVVPLSPVIERGYYPEGGYMANYPDSSQASSSHAIRTETMSHIVSGLEDVANRIDIFTGTIEEMQGNKLEIDKEYTRQYLEALMDDLRYVQGLVK